VKKQDSSVAPHDKVQLSPPQNDMPSKDYKVVSKSKRQKIKKRRQKVESELGVLDSVLARINKCIEEKAKPKIVSSKTQLEILLTHPNFDKVRAELVDALNHKDRWIELHSFYAYLDLDTDAVSKESNPSKTYLEMLVKNSITLGDLIEQLKLIGLSNMATELTKTDEQYYKQRS